MEKEKTHRKIAILQEELENLHSDKLRRIAVFQETVAKMGSDLEKAQRALRNTEVK